MHKNVSFNHCFINVSTQVLTEQEQIIVDYIKQYKFIRRSTVEDILDVKKTRAYEAITS